MASTVLIVDDLVQNVDAFCEVLNSYFDGLVLLTANNGKDALELVKRSEPDLIMLDVHMPEMDGFEVCRRLKSDPRTMNIPVLMISALMTSSHDRSLGMDSGAEGYLCKPFEMAELVAQVRALIRLKHMGDTLRDDKRRLEVALRERTESLRMSEAHWRRLFAGAPDAVFIESLEGEVLEVNDAGCLLHGMTRDELIGKHVSDLVPEAQRSEVRKHFGQWSEESMHIYRGESLRRDGSSVPVEIHGRKFDYLGRPALLFHVRDIRNRVKMEQDLMHAQKFESLGVMAKGIAADYNQVLTGMIGQLTVARQSVDQDSRLNQILCELEAATLRAKLMTNQLLLFAESEPPEFRAVSLIPLLERTPEYVVDNPRIEFVSQVSDDLWEVPADKTQISQMLVHLLSNAVQAMPDGGVLTLVAENVVTKLPAFVPDSGSRTERSVKLVVKDTGCGMSPEVMSRAFDPYFTTREGASGIGLSTVFAIVQKHRGTTAVESSPGQGATFTVYLPAANPDLAVKPGKVDAATTAEGEQKRRILVMDDEKSILTILSATLKRLGYEADGVADGQAAIDAYKRALDAGEPYAAVIMDLTIPDGMGGEETVRLLNALDPNVCAIVSSGHVADRSMKVPELSGFKAAIEKPYSAAKLGQVLDAVLPQ